MSDEYEEGQDEAETPDPSAELQARLDKIEAENKALRQQMTQAAFAQAPEKPQQKVVPQLDLKSLDPSDENYGTEASRRIDAYVQQRLQAERDEQAQVSTRTSREDQLFESFKAKYPEIAANQEKVYIAASLARTKAAQKGIDPDRYMFQASDMYFDDVVAEHKRLFGEATAPAKAEEEETRTGGLFGGLEGVGKPTGGKGKGKGEELGSLSADLKAFQRTAGIAW